MGVAVGHLDEHRPDVKGVQGDLRILARRPLRRRDAAHLRAAQDRRILRGAPHGGAPIDQSRRNPKGNRAVPSAPLFLVASRSLWLSYIVRPASFSISYDPMIIFRTSKHVEDLIMLSFAGRLCERHAMAAALIGCARRIRATAANWRHAAIASVTDPYRPELHYMRGPGPKWRQKHATWRHGGAASLPSTARGASSR